MTVRIKEFFHSASSTYSYVVADSGSGTAAIIDPVLDYDDKAGRTATSSADEIIAYIRSSDLKLNWILETHAHADHLSSAQYIKDELGGQVAIGQGIREVQRTFRVVFNLGNDFPADGSHFDRLFADGDTFDLGCIVGRVMHTPGHTNDSVTYVIGDSAFIGDTMFMPDFGTARCDFPGGDARKLYQSIKKILALPSATGLYMCHDYAPGGRDYLFRTTVAEQKKANIHIHDGVGEDEFVVMREKRDRQLSVPNLIMPSIQVNIRAGDTPPPEDNGVSYLKIPINAL